ncbi:MAG: cohesin domain-containing protein, partial [Clostridia bacterium]
MLRTLKKSLSLLLVVCLLTSFVGMAFAEGEVVPPPVDPPAPVDPAIVTIATVAAVAGDSITVDVSVTKNPGFSAYAFSVSYDDKVLTPTDATTLLTGAFTKNLAVENEVGSSILASFKGSEDITGDTVLFTMTFAVKADA